MNPIDKDEIFQNLSGFLKAKGIELKEGSYAHGIQKGCTLLTEAINLSQKGLKRAKAGVDKKLDQMRQVIHEKTAGKPPVRAGGSGPTAAAAAASAAEPANPRPKAAAAPSAASNRKTAKRKKRGS